MALQLSRATAVGVNALYWRIGILNFHPRTSSCQVVLDGYPSKSVRDGGAAPLASLNVELPFAECGDGDRASVYLAVKKQDEWAEASDV